MATKYTRKQLRKPDEFISLSYRAWEVVRAHMSRVLLMLGVTALIVAGAWTWSYFDEGRAMKSTDALSRAFDIYGQTVIPTTEKLPPAEDGLPRFSSRSEKLKAAGDAFGQVAAETGGRLGQIALLMRAGVRYDRGDLAEAAKDYEEFLQRNRDASLRRIAIEGLGYSLEAAGKLDQALEQFRKLGGEGEEKLEAMYHEGRILVRKGKYDEATKLYRSVLEKAASPTLAERAGSALALLQSGKGSVIKGSLPQKAEAVPPAAGATQQQP